MSEDTSEKGLSIINKIFKNTQKKDIASLTNPSDFEQNLFSDGVYLYDFEREIGESENIYNSYHKWLSENRDSQASNVSLSFFVGSERHDIMWKQAFSGKIPKAWGVAWYNVRRSFEEEGKNNVQLTSDLVSAGITHEHHIVVYETGKSQKLSIEQLAVVIVRKNIKNIPESSYSQIVSFQEDKGMTRKDLNDAIKIASELTDVMNKRKEEEKSTFIQPPIPKLIT